ncbi:putative inorganic carbon transporter subunit DabA [Idiomarina sp.]|uniref:putative inorganic carbon transporter subunit DabA n=1 Tax=Idiomarina sp. TaxID=1874361 RepID=UPI00260B6F58|nr:putative inorganic carbon transporter subunit DabA [Idiomarina sp.]
MISVSRFVSIAEQVSQSVAPQWPLSQWIAVNPFWQYRNKPVEDVAAHWRYSAGSRLLMSPEFYWQKWQQNDIDKQHVTDKMVEQLQQRVSIITPIPQWQNLSRLVDKYQQRSRKMRWNEEVVLQISQTCGLFMQFPKRFQEEGSDSSLYSHWLTISRADRGIETLMDEADLNELFAELPDDPHELIKVCQASFLTDASDYALQCYCQALISDLWGWAAAFSYQDARQDSQWVFDLLCIRLAWEYLLWHLAERTNTSVHEQLKSSFNEQLEHCLGWVGYAQQYNELLWKWQGAYERSQVTRLKFTSAEDAKPSKAPEIQAVFCIDVRSERYRRALEKAGQALSINTQTKGFAGFFGVPLALKTRSGSNPHVPGLLQPSYYIQAPEQKQSVTSLLANLFNTPVSMFSGVEALGLSKLKSLLTGVPGKIATADAHAKATVCNDDGEVSTDALVAICEQALAGMQFQAFGQHIVLVGHGSHHSNNAQRAGLNCGACGGQTGALSARVLTGLLNDTTIREHLRERGFDIPAKTRFYSALHETVTDRIVWLSDAVPGGVKRTFNAASESLANNSREPFKARKKRSSHWAELRPEWGLADNNTLFFGRSERLVSADTSGSNFLHDYYSDNDLNGALLSQLFSAPGLVANWINWQYYCSVTDPKQLGSGNKLLHNRVANDIGVFEGNGGDLRQGIAWQSVHDGKDFVHRPMRLQVIVEATEDIIQKALAGASDFNQLFQHDWINLYRLDERGELCPVTK